MIFVSRSKDIKFTKVELKVQTVAQHKQIFICFLFVYLFIIYIYFFGGVGWGPPPGGGLGNRLQCVFIINY